MRICKDHWELCRNSVKEQGMGHLGAHSSEEAVADMQNQLKGERTQFDPLMELNWYWQSNAVKNGGLRMMCQTEDGSNDGHYCPICEFVKHDNQFVPKEAVDLITKQMRLYAVKLGLLPQIQ